MNNSFLALPVGRVGWGYSKKLFINSNQYKIKVHSPKGEYTKTKSPSPNGEATDLEGLGLRFLFFPTRIFTFAKQGSQFGEYC